MRESFSLGRIAGIRVGVNWSVLVILLLIALGLARGRLPDAYPGRSGVAYWGLGLAAAVIFFASLLAHELSHAIVAKRNGVEVDGITLWLLGGVARLKGEAGTPGAELRIAAVGPLTSLVLGGFFIGIAALLGALSVPGLLVEAVAWLGAINVLLAVFNALPAAPLDGGRLLRAFLWWRTGDRLRAAAGATAAGRALGWLLLFLGVLLAVSGAGLDGLWLAFIGWFVLAAATAEGQQAQLRGLLAGVPVRQAMTPDPVSVRGSATLAELADHLRHAPIRQRHSAFPVLGDGQEVVGLLSWSRVDDVPAEKRALTMAADTMWPLAAVVTTGPDEPLADLLPRLQASEARRALVLDGGRLVGIVTMTDVTRAVSWLASGRTTRRDW